MAEKNVEETLWRVFENINRWLQYAERKNAVVLTFIGIQLTLIKVLVKDIDGWLFILSLVVLGLCFVTTLISFFPQTIIPWWFYFYSKSSDETSEEDNLLFYGHIKKYSQSAYVDTMEKYLGGVIRGHRTLEDLCGQIVRNSEIASKKFRIFKVTAVLLIAGQILLLISLGC